MKKIELLSPAGNMECLYAAINAGADAVYLGGTMFGARAFAGNFTNEELKKAVCLCHLYGVKVYVTCNILIYEHEINHFMEYVKYLHQIMVDAIIIQDLGMLDLVHKTFPNLELHASTQMHIHNLDGVLMAQKLGCKRVVLARETPIETIEDIKKKTDVELEIFAHGALCVSYSGQCLFSSLIGNRSGNRGSCVGSCRLPYDICDIHGKKLNKGDYPLSMKDLNTLEYLGKLIDSGVTSLKLEGRMKSKEYVYTVTKLYRMAIDSYYEKGIVTIDFQELDYLKRLFNREFTKGYLFHEDMNKIINDVRPNHQGILIGKVVDYQNNFVYVKLLNNLSIHDGIRIVLDRDDYGLELNEFYKNKKLVKEAFKDDIISFKVLKKIPINSTVLLTKDNSLITTIDEKIKNISRKIAINGKIIIQENKPLQLYLSDGKNEVFMEGKVVSKANNNPLTKEIIQNKLSKLGDTIYKLNKLEIILDNNVFIPLKELNELRHEAIKLLDNKRLYTIPYLKKEYHIDVSDYKMETKKSILLKAKENLSYDSIYSEKMSDDCIIKLPKVMTNYDDLDIHKEYLCGELGAFNKLKKIYCDYSFNVTNSYTVALLHSLGAKRITLSLELTPKQVKNIIEAYHNRMHKHPNLEVIIKGRREVMTLKTNLNQKYGDNIFLVDRFKNKYPIKRQEYGSIIYDYHYLNDLYDYYSIGVNYLRENREITG